MTDFNEILTELAKCIISNNLHQVNQAIEDYNILRATSPETVICNLSMLSSEDQQTPAALIEKLLAPLKRPDGTIDINAIYLDPCCGRGTILAYLHTHYNIPKDNLYGIDIKIDNVELCTNLGYNVILGDMLTQVAYDKIDELVRQIKGDNMKKINKVLMNPPYCGPLHLKCLNKINEVYPEATVVNLSPVLPLYEYVAYGRKNVLDNINDYHITEIITEQEAEKSFGLSNLGSDLGIWIKVPNSEKNNNLSIELFGDKYALITKMWEKVKNSEKLAPHTHKWSECTKQFILKLVYGLSLSNHGLRTPSSYNLTSLNYNTAIVGIDSTHTRYVEYDTEEERKIGHELYSSPIMKFFYKYVLNGRCDYNLVPWFTSLPGELTSEEFLINFFDLTEDDLTMIYTEMKDYIYGEE